MLTVPLSMLPTVPAQQPLPPANSGAITHQATAAVSASSSAPEATTSAPVVWQSSSSAASGSDDQADDEQDRCAAYARLAWGHTMATLGVAEDADKDDIGCRPLLPHGDCL